MTLRVASSEFSTKIGVRTENGAAAAEAVEAAGVAGAADAAADAADAVGAAEAGGGVDGLAGDAAVVGLQAPSDSASRLAEEERRQSRREIMRRGVG
ncbi:hypothetical protein MASR2M32_17770 [Sphaerotilus sulfidivorans]|jgi:hypothetical protein|nr:hypothetical protein QMTAC487_17770 [Sphaerotilus sp. FB-3]